MANRDDDTTAGPAADGASGFGRRFLLGTMQLSAGGWVVSIINLAIGVALTRILGPEAFGLFAFVFAINELINIIGAFSIGSALIQSRHESQSLYDSALAISAALGLAGMAIAFCGAFVLYVYRGPQEAWFLIVLGGARILVLLSQIPRAKLERSLRYGTVTTLSIVESSIPNLAALGLAYIGFGAWALVWREVLIGGLMFALESGASGYRFRGKIERISSQQLMRFAKPMFFAHGIAVVVERADRIAIGAFMGNAAAGLIDRGRFIAEMGRVVIRPVERSSFNLFSRLQEDYDRLSRSFSLVSYFLIRVMFASSVVLALTPVESVRLIYGEEWLAAAPILKWLAIYAALVPMFGMIRVLVIAQDKVPRIALISGLQAGLLIPATIAAGYYDSLQGAAIAVVVVAGLGVILGGAAIRDLVTVSYRRLLAAPLAASVGTVFLICALDYQGWLDPVTWYLRPFLVGIMFCTLLLALDRSDLIRELQYLRAQMSSRREP